MMSCNNFPKYTKYQKLIEEGFQILKPSLYQNFEDIWDYELIGEPQLDLRTQTNNLYYELYRLVEWLQFVERRLESCLTGCITEEESKKIRDKFLIDCPLICSNPESLRLIRLFEAELPICGTESYRWIGGGTCLVGDFIYQTLELTRDGQSTIQLVPLTAGLQYYLDLGIPQAEAQRLIQTRVIELESENCCPYQEVNAPFVQIVSVTATAISVEYQLNNPQASGTIRVGNQTQTVTTSSGTIIFTGLIPGTAYQVEFTVGNCAGQLTLTVPVSTPPYLVTITLGQNLIGNVELLNGLQVGVNTFLVYCNQVNIGFQGINQIHEIRTFTSNGQNVLNQVVWNQVINNKNIGGTFTIPCIDRDYELFIDGVRALDCDNIVTSVSGNTITISL